MEFVVQHLLKCKPQSHIGQAAGEQYTAFYRSVFFWDFIQSLMQSDIVYTSFWTEIVNASDICLGLPKSA